MSQLHVPRHRIPARKCQRQCRRLHALLYPLLQRPAPRPQQLTLPCILTHSDNADAGPDDLQSSALQEPFMRTVPFLH
jgi:hypothetical protein